jgi:hypothetical protein
MLVPLATLGLLTMMREHPPMGKHRVVDLQDCAVAGHHPSQRAPRLKQLLPDLLGLVREQRIPRRSGGLLVLLSVNRAAKRLKEAQGLMHLCFFTPWRHASGKTTIVECSLKMPKPEEDYTGSCRIRESQRPHLTMGASLYQFLNAAKWSPL